jgi:hypothetical protein
MSKVIKDKVSILTKTIPYCGKEMIFACDKKCNKAFGINGREKKQLSDDEDDYQYLTDSEVGNAPQCMGTWEGGDGKPLTIAEAPNKWCVRECERSALIEEGDSQTINDFNFPVFNFCERADSELSGNDKIPVIVLKLVK